MLVYLSTVLLLLFHLHFVIFFYQSWINLTVSVLRDEWLFFVVMNANFFLLITKYQ